MPEPFFTEVDTRSGKRDKYNRDVEAALKMICLQIAKWAIARPEDVVEAEFPKIVDSIKNTIERDAGRLVGLVDDED